MCLFNFVEAELDIDVSVQAEFAKLLFKLDFGSIEAGGFRALVDTPRFAVSYNLHDISMTEIIQLNKIFREKQLTWEWNLEFS